MPVVRHRRPRAFRLLHASTVAAVATALAACSSAGDGSATGTAGGHGGGSPSGGTFSGGVTGGGGGGGYDYCKHGPVGGARPADVRVFASYDCTKAAPLVVLLHDYASSGAEAEAHLGLAAEADARGFLYVHPDGTRDATGNAFWSATDACCDADGAKVDDSAYLGQLLWDIRAEYNVDPKRVYVIGDGNGGFMAHRLACDHAPQVTAIASLGGAGWADASRCAAKAPVGLVEIHGTADATFAYGGGTHLGHAYPSAQKSAADWAAIDKCKGAIDASPAPIDLDATLPGNETTVARYAPCVGASSVELWTIQGGTHAIAPSTRFAPALLDWLFAHTKP